MKKLLLVLILFSSLMINKLTACTSFACYGQRPLYGMNFDYPDMEINLRIRTFGDIKIFELLFDTNILIFGVNSNGVFTNCQELYPVEPMNNYPSSLDLYYGELCTISLDYINDATEMRTFLTESARRIRQYEHISLHSMIADKNTAFVAEPGDSCNMITDVKDSVLIMANFPNHKFVGVSPRFIQGVGANRWRTLNTYVKTHRKNFEVENGFEGLSKCRMTDPRCRTQSSAVCDPDSNYIYLSFRNDFSKIWRVRLDEGILETYKGFDQYQSLELDETGFTVSYLGSITTDIINNGIYPTNFELKQNYPNPFNPLTKISYTLADRNNVKITVHDLLGREVALLIDAEKSAGKYQVEFDASGLSSGTYIYQLRTNNGVISKKMTLLK